MGTACITLTAGRVLGLVRYTHGRVRPGDGDLGAVDVLLAGLDGTGALLQAAARVRWHARERHAQASQHARHLGLQTRVRLICGTGTRHAERGPRRQKRRNTAVAQWCPRSPHTRTQHARCLHTGAVFGKFSRGYRALRNDLKEINLDKTQLYSCRFPGKVEGLS